MKLIKTLLRLVLVALVLIAAVVLYKTLTMGSRQPQADPIPKRSLSAESLSRFSRAIQLKTISPENISDFDSLQFLSFNSFLQESYPLTDSLLEHRVFNSFSHLYTWRGSNSELKPAVLMAHLDVVPVIKENVPHWKEGAFSGAVVSDTVWGRGTIDDKVGVIGILEAVEHLLEEGFTPQRTLYLAFGHDEEIGGSKGAAIIARHLEAQGVEAEFVLDEGGSRIEGMIPGMEGPVALIGIAEKGFVSLEMSVEMVGGHSSMPERETAIDVLSAAVSKLKNNPFPARISAPIKGFMDYLGPEMPFVNKMAFANPWLFKPLIISAYESSGSGNALMRTTTAPTMFHSGVKDNILPRKATATVNFRVISGSSTEEVKAHVRAVVDDHRIQIKEGRTMSEPSTVSGLETFGFEKVAKTIVEVYPGTAVAPYLVVGGTDSKHFEGVSDRIYRFSPVLVNNSNVKTFHGINERLAVSDFEDSVRFYLRLIENCSEQ